MSVDKATFIASYAEKNPRFEICRIEDDRYLLTVLVDEKRGFGVMMDGDARAELGKILDSDVAIGEVIRPLRASCAARTTMNTRPGSHTGPSEDRGRSY